MYRPQLLLHTSICEYFFYHFLLSRVVHLSALDPSMSLGARPPFYWYICLVVHVGRKLIRYHDQVQRLIGKCFIGHTSSHLYPIVTQKLYMCFIVHFKPAVLHIMSSYTLWHLYWKNFPSWTLGSEVWLKTKWLLSIRRLCYQNQLNIPGELCFLNRETIQLQSCISLLLIKFIYLIKFNLMLTMIMYTILFQNPFSTNLLSLSRPKQICLVFLHQETSNCRTKLLSLFFLNKNIFILYTFSLLTTYILLALYTKMFCLSFLHITIFNPWKL